MKPPAGAGTGRLSNAMDEESFNQLGLVNGQFKGNWSNQAMNSPYNLSGYLVTYFWNSAASRHIQRIDITGNAY